MPISETELRQIIRGTVHEELDRHTQASQRQSQESHVDHVCNCPNCLCDTIEKLKKTSTAWCENCKMPLGTEEVARKIPACPMCGSKKAMRAIWNDERKRPEKTQ